MDSYGNEPEMGMGGIGGTKAGHARFNDLNVRMSKIDEESVSENMSASEESPPHTNSLSNGNVSFIGGHGNHTKGSRFKLQDLQAIDMDEDNEFNSEAFYPLTGPMKRGNAKSQQGANVFDVVGFFLSSKVAGEDDKKSQESNHSRKLTTWQKFGNKTVDEFESLKGNHHRFPTL